MKCLIDVVTNRKNTFMLSTENLELIESPNFLQMLSAVQAEEQVITDSDGGVLTDTYRYYHLAINPMLSDADLIMSIKNAK